MDFRTFVARTLPGLVVVAATFGGLHYVGGELVEQAGRAFAGPQGVMPSPADAFANSGPPPGDAAAKRAGIGASGETSAAEGNPSLGVQAGDSCGFEQATVPPLHERASSVPSQAPAGVVALAAATPAAASQTTLQEAQARGLPAVIRQMTERGAEAVWLGDAGGAEGWLVSAGGAPVTVYTLPGGDRAVVGMMVDAAGTNLSREQLASIVGAPSSPVAASPAPSSPAPAMPAPTASEATASKGTASVPTASAPVANVVARATAEPGRSAEPQASPAGRGIDAEGLLAAVEAEATSFVLGDESAPAVYVFDDPTCVHCTNAFVHLGPAINEGLFHLRVVPVGVRSHEAWLKAAAMLSSEEPAIAFLENKRLFVSGGIEALAVDAVAPGVAEALDRNRAIMDRFSLGGTPSFVLRAASGKAVAWSGAPKAGNVVPDIIARY